MKKTDIKDRLYDLIYTLESDRAKGKYGDGLWHHATATMSCGKMEIVIGCDASPCYSEAEYYGKGEFPPVTFWKCQEYYSPSPSEESLEWNDCEWSETNVYYAHLPEEFADYKCIDQEDIEELKAAGYIPFKLGDLIEPLDIDDQVNEALENICIAWNIKN